MIVVAATNRPDILDSALMRPGRFDRQVYVTLPDIRGREQILGVHMRKIPIGQDVEFKILTDYFYSFRHLRCNFRTCLY